MAKRKVTTQYYPTQAQRDASRIQTAKVQYWSGGVMAGLILKDHAIDLVNKGSAFIISSQAVGAMNPDGSSNS